MVRRYQQYHCNLDPWFEFSEHTASKLDSQPILRCCASPLLVPTIYTCAANCFSGSRHCIFNRQPPECLLYLAGLIQKRLFSSHYLSDKLPILDCEPLIVLFYVATDGLERNLFIPNTAIVLPLGDSACLPSVASVTMSVAKLMQQLLHHWGYLLRCDLMPPLLHFGEKGANLQPATMHHYFHRYRSPFLLL